MHIEGSQEVVTCRQEGLGVLVDIRARLLEGQAARGEGGARQRSEWAWGWRAVRLLGEEGDHEGQEAQHVYVEMQKEGLRSA
jgi:hypothetical protein